MRIFLLAVAFAGTSPLIAIAGDIIAVGGGDDREFLPLFVEMIHNKEGLISVIACAQEPSTNQLDTSLYYKQRLEELGQRNVYCPIILNREDSNSERISTQIQKSRGVFVTGGNQKLLLDRILNTKSHGAIVSACKSGAVYYGNSAGTAVIGPVCITGNDSHSNITTEDGLGVVSDIVFDQHFSQRNRVWRLERIAKQFQVMGAGVDEQTALVIIGNQQMIVGKHSVHWTNVLTKEK